MYFTNANFNISAAYSKSAGLFKVNEGVHRGTKLLSKFSLIFSVKDEPSFLEISRLEDDLTAQELVEFLFSRRHCFDALTAVVSVYE